MKLTGVRAADERGAYRLPRAKDKTVTLSPESRGVAYPDKLLP